VYGELGNRKRRIKRENKRTSQTIKGIFLLVRTGMGGGISCLRSSGVLIAPDRHQQSSSSPMTQQKPEHSILTPEERSQHLSIIVLGASGDLAKKKTYPALFALYSNNLLPTNTIIYGYARSESTDEKFRENMAPRYVSYKSDEIYVKLINALRRLKGSGDKQKFLSLLHYQHGGYDSAESFAKLAQTLDKAEGGKGNRVSLLMIIIFP
jgi:Glucose-6-phosphate dehydrogenase, NAD binding domain